MSTQMIDEARRYVESRRGDWKALADETGLSESWLSKFARGVDHEPGYYKVEKLYQLAAKPARKRKLQKQVQMKGR